MLAIIDYGFGNIRSVHKALLAAGAQDVVITHDPDIINNADKLVLPGVGAYAQCMGGILAIDGLIDVLQERVIQKQTPFLGICVGMQLLADCGVEFESVKGLGWISGEVTRLEPKNHDLKIPQMGWNETSPNNCKYFDAAWDNKAKDVYYVHSFAFRAKNPENIAASCTYGADTFAAAVQKDNIFGVQFHPEKSQKAGLKLLNAWLENND
jgi:imidazole glycerol-phosphate synthase subunit HisH